jgi:hypothetical protein
LWCVRILLSYWEIFFYCHWVQPVTFWANIHKYFINFMDYKSCFKQWLLSVSTLSYCKFTRI